MTVSTHFPVLGKGSEVLYTLHLIILSRLHVRSITMDYIEEIM